MALSILVIPLSQEFPFIPDVFGGSFSFNFNNILLLFFKSCFLDWKDHWEPRWYIITCFLLVGYGYVLK